MSLINEALKRAGQKPVSPPSASETAAGLRPAEERPHGFPVLTLFIVLIPLIATGLWFLVKGLQMKDQPVAVDPPPTIAARTMREPPAPVAVQTPPTNAPSVPPSPAYKLQGIYWRPAKPSAVVNGKTVYIGDRVETARVTAIDQESVTLLVDGQPKVLLLP